jgi:hypothetical protein
MLATSTSQVVLAFKNHSSFKILDFAMLLKYSASCRLKIGSYRGFKFWSGVIYGKSTGSIMPLEMKSC